MGVTADPLALMLARLADIHPGDRTYARTMQRLVTAVEGFNHRHARMVECYEDGLMGGASRYAGLAAEQARVIADLHEKLGAAFADLPARSCHPADRHPANRGGYVEPLPTLDTVAGDPAT